MTFYQWLQSQTDRRDIVGDFAYTISQLDDEPHVTRQRRKKNAHKMWADWLLERKASREVLSAFNIAWQAYQETQSSDS